MARSVRFAGSLFVLAVFTGVAIGQEKQPETYTERLPGNGATVTFELVRIPGGTFAMKVGEEEKPVTVKPFWMGKTEVRWDEYDVFKEGLDLPTANDELKVHMKALDLIIATKTRPSRTYGHNPDADFGHAGYPGISIHYNGAAMYCKWLSERTGKTYRLPTEAEWEWACRAGGDGARPPAEQLGEIAWYRENSTPEGAERPQTALVGKKRPSAYGLHDMLGNVMEWTTVMDVSGDTPEVERYVTKGGFFDSTPAGLHSRFRQFLTPRWQSHDSQDPKSRWWLSDGNFVGFRVVRED